MKAFTDIEQSLKLAEILPIESADNYYSWHDNRYYVVNKDCPYPSSLKEKIPCWSLATLMNLLPSEFTKKGEYSETTYKIDIRKYALTEDVDIYQIAYGSIIFDVDGQHSFKDMINTGQKENLIDAAFQMICWLKENNLL